MTDFISNFTLGLPAGNGSKALFFDAVNLGDSEVEYVTIVFPPGCSGLVGVRLEFAVNPVYPTPAGSFFIFDDYTFTVQVSGQGNSGQWRAVGYNQDTYFHTIQTYWGWNKLKRVDTQSAATLISLLGRCRMSIGYPDYARLSQQGGTQLYAANNSTPPENTVLFKGYVGSWPYCNLITNIPASSEITQYKLQYFNDATFSTLVGEHHCTRTGLTFGYTQYANMSPFMQFFYVTQSGLAMPVSQLNLYATTGPGDSKSLYDLTEGILVGTESIAASTTSTHFPVLINPGRSTFQLQTAGTSWFVNVSYLSFAQNGYILYKQFNSTKWGTDIQAEFPMLDAPHKVEVHNSAAASTTFVYGWASD